MKNFVDELAGYRFRVEREGREVINIPGLLALPGLLIAPKVSIIGMLAAPLLGCRIHLGNTEGKDVDVGKKVQEAAETVAGAVRKTAMTIKEEIDKAWEAASADDPEPVAEEPVVEEPAAEAAESAAPEEIPVIEINPDDTTEA